MRLHFRNGKMQKGGEKKERTKSINISMLLIFRIEKFHGDQFWMNCYFTIYLTIEPNRMRISIATAFFFPVFVLRFNKHHTFHHKFIFCMIFFFYEKSTILHFTVMIGAVFRRFLTRFEVKKKIITTKEQKNLLKCIQQLARCI